MVGSKRRFVHLSDIHFSNKAATFGFDPDRELRDAVRRDIAEMGAKLGRADAVLVSGDVAYAGKRDEYEDAARWLDTVCEAAGCGAESVFVCPGNHDVDQSVIRNNPLIQDGHDAVRRGITFQERDQALTQRLVQPVARALFYSSLNAYNEFAARYQSSFFADSTTFVWEHDFALNDGSTLRLRGLNTALLSGLADVEGSMFLGSRAWTLPRQTGVEYLTMAHHPPAWLADKREAERAFEGGARVHLFGHEHDQRIQPGRDWIKLFAGAINPHRAEANWRPGYNVVEIEVQSHPLRRLVVDVHAREWQGSPPQFRAIEDVNHSPVFHVEIQLPELPPTVQFLEPAKESSTSAIGGRTDAQDPAMEPQQRFRLVVFRFFRLSLSKKNEVIGHMRLAAEDDSRLPDVERFKLALVRAREQKRMDELEQQIDAQEKN